MQWEVRSVSHHLAVGVLGAAAQSVPAAVAGGGGGRVAGWPVADVTGTVAVQPLCATGCRTSGRYWQHHSFQ